MNYVLNIPEMSNNDKPQNKDKNVPPPQSIPMSNIPNNHLINNNNNTSLNIKSVRGRFTIQEIVDTPKLKSPSNPNILEYKKRSKIEPISWIPLSPSSHQINKYTKKRMDILNLNSDTNNNVGNRPKRRRNSANNSKFKLNYMPASKEKQKTKIWIYDINTKRFHDICVIFRKYSHIFPSEILARYSTAFKTSLMKRRLWSDIGINCKEDAVENNKDTTSLSNCPLLKKGDFKRIESNFHLTRGNNFSDIYKTINEQVNQGEGLKVPKTEKIKMKSTNLFHSKYWISPHKKHFSLNDRIGFLKQERAVNIFIESQQFNICSLVQCQFSI